ncbi:hypothetical protein EH223_04065 [candidate division KSB1 bacterium]|nr:flavodoxin domain-containing protein [candidate division KSB1 bacterium]RQW05658.1 MAG: hypothetical protein EH223_04065 [candidate division KSB1 bacterium]
MDTLSKEVLVTYSSGYGATKEVAEEIAKILSDQLQCKVVSKSIHECEGIQDYDAVILGASIRAERPLANARDFFSKHKYELAQKKLAIFVVSITASIPAGVEIAKKRYASQLHNRYPWLSPMSIAAFGGKVDFSKLNPVMQNLVRNVMQEKGVRGNGSFDARNWDDIRAWAKQIAFQLQEPSIVV